MSGHKRSESFGLLPPSCAIWSDTFRYAAYAFVAAASASSSEAKTGLELGDGFGGAGCDLRRASAQQRGESDRHRSSTDPSHDPHKTTG